MRAGETVVETTECSIVRHREELTACFHKFGRVVFIFADRVSCWVVNSDDNAARAARIETKNLRPFR
jgi:hypothetical protein